MFLFTPRLRRTRCSAPRRAKIRVDLLLRPKGIGMQFGFNPCTLNDLAVFYDRGAPVSRCPCKGGDVPCCRWYLACNLGTAFEGELGGGPFSGHAPEQVQQMQRS